MRKVVDLCKQSKKAQKAFYAAQRGSWNGVNPVSRVVPNGKAYSRAKAKPCPAGRLPSFFLP